MEIAEIRNGNMQGFAYADFVEAENGDLVDIEYYCREHAPNIGAWYPAYDWPEYDVHCATCGTPLNVVEKDRKFRLVEAYMKLWDYYFSPANHCVGHGKFYYPACVDCLNRNHKIIGKLRDIYTEAGGQIIFDAWHVETGR